MKAPNDRHKLLINEKEAPVIITVFEMAAQGKSGQQIAKYLNEHKMPSNRKNNNCLWTSKTVLKKIRNEIYSGTFVQGKSEMIGIGDDKKTVSIPPNRWIRTENAVEPIVSKELFIKANEHFPQYNIQLKKHTSEINLFVCPYCGRKMKLQYRGRRYQCRMKNVSTNVNCQTLHEQAKELQQAVLETVKKHIEAAVDRYKEIQKTASNETDKLNKRRFYKFFSFSGEKSCCKKNP